MSGVNRMDRLVSLLGVEFGEEFNIIEGCGTCLEYSPHHFTRYGVVDKDGDDANSILHKLVRGDYTIEKIPFTPKDGEEYFTYYFGDNDNTFNGRILTNSWEGSPRDKMNRLLGIIFRTYREAEDYLPTFKRRLEGEEV